MKLEANKYKKKITIILVLTITVFFLGSSWLIIPNIDTPSTIATPFSNENSDFSLNTAAADPDSQGDSQDGDDCPSDSVVVSDKPFYLWGEVVTILGLGFNPETQIIINITRPCGCGMHESHLDTINHIYADIDGEFTVDYSNTLVQGQYNITATDGITITNSSFWVRSCVIWTDKLHYEPNEIVTISGTGFNPNAIINITIICPDNSTESWEFPADEYGNFTTTYNLNGIAGDYYVGATDEVNFAITMFSDAYLIVSPSFGVPGTYVVVDGYGFKGSGDLKFRGYTSSGYYREYYIGGFYAGSGHAPQRDFRLGFYVPSWVQYGRSYSIYASSRYTYQYVCGEYREWVCDFWLLFCWFGHYEYYNRYCWRTDSYYASRSYPITYQPRVDPNGWYFDDEGVSMQFDGTGSYDPDGSINVYQWDFNYDPFLQTWSPERTTGYPIVTYTYTNPGIYYVGLRVRDNQGVWSNVRWTLAIVGVELEPPIADADGPYSRNAGQTVFFDGSGSHDPDGSIVSYFWDFGDGYTGAGINPTHTYLQYGTYEVTLTVTDNFGLTNTDTTLVYINDVTPPATIPIISGIQDSAGKFISDVTVELSATDFGSSVAETLYSFDKNTWHTYTTPFTILEPPGESIYFYSIDDVGNVEPTKTEVVLLGGTVYIKPDGSVFPSVAPISIGGIGGNVYMFTANIYANLIVQKDNIVIHGFGYKLHGYGLGHGIAGIDMRNRNGVTIQDLMLE